VGVNTYDEVCPAKKYGAGRADSRSARAATDREAARKGRNNNNTIIKDLGGQLMKKKQLLVALLVAAGLSLLATMAWGSGSSSDEEEEEEEVWTGVYNADLAHTNENPFCDDDSCDCHQEPDAVEQVQQDIQDGLMTTDEATRHYYGKNI
jgi:hypothetical protein